MQLIGPKNPNHNNFAIMSRVFTNIHGTHSHSHLIGKLTLNKDGSFEFKMEYFSSEHVLSKDFLDVAWASTGKFTEDEHSVTLHDAEVSSKF